MSIEITQVASISATPLAVDAKEAARLLSIGESTLWRLARAGKLPEPIKIGGATRWRVADLQQHLAGPASPPTTASARAAA